MGYPSPETIESPETCIRIYQKLIKDAAKRKVARQYLDRALELDSKNLETIFLKGEDLRTSYQTWPQALDCFNEVINEGWEQGFVWALIRKGGLLVSLDRMEQARTVLAHAQQLAVKEQTAMTKKYGNQLYFLLLKESVRAGYTKRIEHTISLLETSVPSEETKMHKARNEIGDNLIEYVKSRDKGHKAYNANKFLDAKKHYEKAMKIAFGPTPVPFDGVKVGVMLTNALINLQEYQEAKDLSNQMLERAYYSNLYWRTRGHIFAHLKQPEMAILALDQAIQLGYTEPDILMLKAACLYDVKQYPAALSCINEALKQKPDHDKAQELKSRIEKRFSGLKI